MMGMLSVFFTGLRSRACGHGNVVFVIVVVPAPRPAIVFMTHHRLYPY